MKKRILTNNTNYKKLIKSCLHPKASGTNAWGCLAKNGMLFRIATLSHIKIPKYIITELVSDNKIILKGDGYYVWKEKKKKRKKKK